MSIKIVFVSNYLTIHQIAVCCEFINQPSVEFVFVSSFGPSSEKAKYQNFENEKFVIKAYHSEAEKKSAIETINNADVVLFGSGDRKLIKNRRKLIFFYSEHPSKTKISFLRKLHLKWIYKKYTNSYMLCASCFTARDFNSIGLFKDRCFIYGYFPLLEHFDKKQRKDDVVHILWAGRELCWKHPEYAFYAAKLLYDSRIAFDVKIVSTTNNEINKLISENQNEPWFSNISFIHPMPNKDLQSLMYESDIFILSSDKTEGWGAVVNEAMNAGCCPVVSANAGCSGYLINDSKNGILFHSKEDFSSKLLNCIFNKEYKTLGENAALTIQNIWNEKTAVSNLCRVFNCILNNIDLPIDLINKGPGTKIL